MIRRNRNKRHKLFTRKYKLFAYAKADQMIEHRFTDDVALVAAENKQKAFKLFSEYYGNVTLDDIDELVIVPEEVNILTDY